MQANLKPNLTEVEECGIGQTQDFHLNLIIFNLAEMGEFLSVEPKLQAGDAFKEC